MLVKRWGTILVLIATFEVTSQAQVTRTDGMLDLSNDLSHTLVEQIPIMPEAHKGTYYFFDDWYMGEIELTSGQLIKGFHLRFDIESNRLEIKTDNAVKVLDGQRVKKFSLIPSNKASQFVNASDFMLSNAHMYGFFEVLAEGGTRLLSRTSITIKKANYNVALDMGSERNEIKKIETFYIFIDDELHKLIKSKKKILPLFGSKSRQIEDFAKTKKLSFKKKEDLIKIVNYYNTIT